MKADKANQRRIAGVPSSSLGGSMRPSPSTIYRAAGIAVATGAYLLLAPCAAIAVDAADAPNAETGPMKAQGRVR